MTEYAVLFASKYAREEHPVFPRAHPLGWVGLVAEDQESAWLKAEQHLLGYWNRVVVLDDLVTSQYPLGELGRL